MRRRDIIGLLSAAAAWPMTAKAQAKLPIIGVLGLGPFRNPGELEHGLADGGLVEGRDYTVEYRSAEAAQYHHPLKLFFVPRPRRRVCALLSG
jgi:hypothetical protein